MNDHPVSMLDKRWHIVTGKGGTGKTTVAVALAIALAQGGRNVLLVEIEGRQGIARATREGELAHAEQPIGKLNTLGFAGHISGMAVDAESALLDYLQVYYKLGSAGKALRKIGAIDFATTVAPGIRDVFLIGRVFDAVQRRDRHGDYVYDAVVLDAPPTGRIHQVLGAAGQVADAAKVGPIKRHGDLITSLLASPATAVHLVALAEEMPVRETIEATASLRDLGVSIGGVVANQLVDVEVPAGRTTRTQIAAGLAEAGVPATGEIVDVLASQLRAYRIRYDAQENRVRDLAETAAPMWRLPLVHGDIDVADLTRFAEMLREQIAEAS